MAARRELYIQENSKVVRHLSGSCMTDSTNMESQLDYIAAACVALS